MIADDHHLDPVCGSSERDATVRGIVVPIVLFLVAFVAVTTLLRPPYSEDEILRAKRAVLAAREGEYDALVLGSSRLYRAFDPAAFERLTGEAGDPVRAFNLSLPYARPHEVDTLIEETLVEHPVRYVFVEVMDWAPSINADLADQDRTIRWHTPRQTASAIRTAWRSEPTTLAKVWATGTHVGHLLKRTANFGGGPLRLRSLVDDGARHRQWTDVIADGHGWVRYEQETDPRYAKERRAFLEKYIDDYRRQVATIDETNARLGSLAGFDVAALREQQAMIRRLGAEPIYIVPNLRRGTPDWHRLDDDGVIDTLFTFNHSGRYPELYAEENRFDRRHLNTAGAGQFTRLIAERFVAWRERDR